MTSKSKSKAKPAVEKKKPKAAASKPAAKKPPAKVAVKAKAVAKAKPKSATKSAAKGTAKSTAKSKPKAAAKPAVKAKAAPKAKAAAKSKAAPKAASKKPVAKAKPAVKAKAKAVGKGKPAAKKAAPAAAARGVLTPRTLRVHAIPLADDDGGRKYTFDAANLAKGIARANTVLAGAKITLKFDPAKDWHPRNSTTLNNLQNGSGKWWEDGNAVAERIPGKIVIFFRHGAGDTPVGWGHAYPPNTGQTVPSSVKLPTDNVNYVAMPHVGSWDSADRGNFLAHEVGHYLGLFHTHPGWGTGEIYQGATTLADAEKNLLAFAAANGGTLSAFNGDLLSDTAADCCRDIYSRRGLSHKADGPASVTVSGKVGGKQYDITFTPPRDNVMSYFFWGAAQRLSGKQADTIQSTLKHKYRKVLIEPPCNPDFHNLDYSRWQYCFDYWYWAGLSPKTLSFNRVGSKTLVSGSFGQRPADPVWSMMTSDGYQQRFNEHKPQGLRPERVVVTATGSGPRYSALWCKAEAGYEASHGMTQAAFEKRWAELNKAGWLHTDLFLYHSGSTLLISAIWVKKSADGNACYFNMTADGYQKRFDDFWKAGLRPTTFCAYKVGSSYRYGAIWERRSGRWSHFFGLTADQYQTKYNEQIKAGMRLHQIQGYGNLFSAIFTG